MQTFLVSPDFRESAKSLDRFRLGKQRVETLQIMIAIFGRPQIIKTKTIVRNGEEFEILLKPEDWKIQTEPRKPGWANHPAVKLWRDHTSWLIGYQSSICREWMRRGYVDTCYEKTLDVWKQAGAPQTDPPWFINDEAFHAAHRGNLVRKEIENEQAGRVLAGISPTHYRDQWPDADPTLPYIW